MAKAACVLNGGMSFAVTLKSLVSASNALTFGVVASNGSIPLSSGDGVGCHGNTIGFYINNVGDQMNNSSKIQVLRMQGDGPSQVVGPSIAMFKVGDRLGFTISPDSKSITFYVNDQSLGLITLPSSFQGPFTPCCTLPNDCCLEIVPVAPARDAPHTGEWRDVKKQKRYSPAGTCLGSISIYCVDDETGEGVRCMHPAKRVIHENHWSCCGSKERNSSPCPNAAPSFATTPSDGPVLQDSGLGGMVVVETQPDGRVLCLKLSGGTVLTGPD
eukprot:CAMPEP_0175133786 /NCGR_PEP_ID=MMETSP0087-20121206/7830_1 /TAXON_ID=136419 /ORGANISM="Unknown Unknown, Strain D1" /LENGTH=271 /DNA_ID=CAMNT_0016416303 /DNA_START=291 /DNA_END=1103 /DNA_ORIENTATION=+